MEHKTSLKQNCACHASSRKIATTRVHYTQIHTQLDRIQLVLVGFRQHIPELSLLDTTCLGVVRGAPGFLGGSTGGSFGWFFSGLADVSGDFLSTVDGSMYSKTSGI